MFGTTSPPSDHCHVPELFCFVVYSTGTESRCGPELDSEEVLLGLEGAQAPKVEGGGLPVGRLGHLQDEYLA